MSEINTNELTRLHNFDLASFKKSQNAMIATSETAYSNLPNARTWAFGNKGYTDEEIRRIVESGSLNEQQRLSRVFFNKDGYYR
jgi:hypothetical protein